MQIEDNKKNFVNPLVESIPIYGSLVVVFFMVLITLSAPLMGWVWVLCACAIVIAYLRLKHSLPNVKNITLNLLAIFCMCLLVYLSDRFGLIATMINLLVVAACLKIINLHTQSDYHLVLIILFFLIACGFLYHQNIYIVAYYFACLVILFVTAFLLNRGNLELKKSIYQSIKLILQSFPIMFLLFVVTPRLPPFWQTPGNTSTETGLSEKITPGDIANLAQSDDLVFRAEFANNNIPTISKRYWRSVVLDVFDGKSWSMNIQNVNYNKILPASETQLNAESALNYRYLIIAQPNNTRWLYSIDIPVVDDSVGNVNVWVNQHYQLFQNKTLNKPSFYMLDSYTQARKTSGETNLQDYLQLPEQTNPKTVEWVRENIVSSMSFDEVVETIESYFLTQPFVYTLKPPLMQTAPIDEFLFDNQRGFCSHYASAMTFMLRLANIPARMVAGYQGGELQGSNVLSIYQYDAHAWLEAFHPQKGWIRLDPTALIAPNRTLYGLMAALDSNESSVFNDNTSDFWDLPILSGLSEYAALIDHNWHQLVLNFDQRTQTDLIKKIFGKLNYETLFTFLILSITVIIIFLTILFLPYQKWFRKDKRCVVSTVLSFLQKQGFERSKDESLAKFVERIREELSPEFAKYLKQFSDVYYCLYYQNHTDINQQQALQKRLLAYKRIIVNHPGKKIKKD